MWVQFREGSTFRDVAALAAVITEDGVDPRPSCSSPTTSSRTRSSRTVLDRVVRRAVEEGIEPLVAIQMAPERRGVFQPPARARIDRAGRLADILFVDDLRDFRPHRVLADGREVGELPAFVYPDKAFGSIRLSRPLTEDDLRIESSGETVSVRVIGVATESVRTDHLIVELPSSTARSAPPTWTSPSWRASSGTAARARSGSASWPASASSAARSQHSSRTTTTTSSSPGCPTRTCCLALERLVETGGGMVAVADGEVLGFVELPIAGLMSDRPVIEVAGQVLALEDAYRRLGSSVESVDDLFVPLAGRDPGASADQPRPRRRTHLRAALPARMSRSVLLSPASAAGWHLGPSASAPSLGAARGSAAAGTPPAGRPPPSRPCARPR